MPRIPQLSAHANSRNRAVNVYPSYFFDPMLPRRSTIEAQELSLLRLHQLLIIALSTLRIPLMARVCVQSELKVAYNDP